MMQAYTLSANCGFLWFKEALQLFGSRAILLILATYILQNVVAIIITVLQPVGLYVTPLLQFVLYAYLFSLVSIVDKRVPLMLGPLFQPVSQRIVPLLVAGVVLTVLNVLFTLMAAGLLGSVNMTALLNEASSFQANEEVMAHLFSGIAIIKMLILLIVSLLINLIFWFVPPLIIWDKLNVGKAIVFSTVAVWRNKLAFLVLGLVLLIAMVICGLVLALLLTTVGQWLGVMGQTLVLQIFAMSVIVVLIGIRYISYLYIFSRQKG